MDTRRCVAYDPETDYYERDRNGDSGCRARRPPGNYYPSSSGGQNYLPYGDSAGTGYYDYRRGGNRQNVYYYGGGGGDRYDDYGSNGGVSGSYPGNYYSESNPCKGCQDRDYGYNYQKPANPTWYDDRRLPSAGGSLYEDRYRPSYGESQRPSYGETQRPSYGESQKHGGNYRSDNIIWDILCFYKAK